ANLAPGKMAELCRAWFAGDIGLARRLNREMFPLNHACFYETNPIPVKTMLHMLGKVGPELRLPLVPPSRANLDKMREALQQSGLLP
ncbi:MAG: dihydrodipicolinate synthase family protein, partial [Desulfovibrionaceae bacterium]|nr:dihydrodipicolinate synthase family protein [Desulfovibrionaceae bacterium]